MSTTERIKELERRVRELEDRPYWPPVVIIQPAAPSPQPYYPPWQPWAPSPLPPFGEPWITYYDGHSVKCEA